jgi:hypothetical protein
MSRDLVQQPRFAVLVGLTWLAVAGALLTQHWAATGQTLLDTDDAMRLVEMRAWLGGQGWFDPHQARVQPPVGFDAHWSRLIDAGLAGLFLVFNVFAEPAFAERLMRATWPLLWLLPTLGAMVAIARRIAGRDAALVALLLAAVGIPAYQQFTPGRIDHHNVQIALTMLAVAATVWSDRLHWCAVAAGALSGLAMAIGFESLPYLAACGAAFAARFVFDWRGAAALRAYGRAFAMTALAAFLVSVGPSHWARGACDALAVNSAAGAVAAGSLLAVAGWFAPVRRIARASAVATAALAALAITLAIEPRCLGGPYAMVDPAVWPIWLADVRENQPLLHVFAKNPLTAAAIAAFPAAALIAAFLLAREKAMRADFGFLILAAAFVLAALTTVIAIRAYSYAMWLGMPLVAALSLRLFAALHLQTLAARLTAALLLTPLALSSAMITVASAAGYNDSESFARPASQACFKNDSYAALAALPAGLVAADTSFGPYILALTPHSVLSAPYHRLSAGIVAAHRALVAAPGEARELLDQWRVTYVVICDSFPPSGMTQTQRRDGLWAVLRAGVVPPWLERVPAPGSPALAVYRVVASVNASR